MWHVTLRGIRAHLGRFFLTALSVMLGIAFLSGTLAFRDVLGQTFDNLSAGTSSNDLTVRGEPIESDFALQATNAMVDAELAADVETVDGVSSSFPTYAGTAILFDENKQPANLAQAPALAFNWVPETDESRLVAGRGPEGPGEIVVEEGTAEQADLQVGDQTVLLVNAEPLDVEVVGILSFGTSMAGASVTILEPEFARMSFSPNGMVSEIAVLLEDGADPQVVRDRIEEALGGDYVVLTPEEVQAEVEEQVSFILDMINTFLLIFVALALGIGIFIIANTFRISVRQRQKEFALLRAVGAAPRQVFGVVFAQAIIIGLVGSAVGVLAGQGLILAIRAGLEAYGMPLDAELIMTPSIIVTSIVIGVLVTIVAALLPARTAALTPPIEAMRETSGATEKPLRLRTWIGTVTLIGGVIAFIVGALRLIDASGTALGIGAALIIIGLIIISPVLIKPAVAVLGWPMRKASPVLGKIATESAMASPRKTASTASALMIGVALVATGATLAASLKASLNDVVETSVTADLVAMTNIPLSDPSAGVAAMESVDGVESVDASVRSGQALLPGDTTQSVVMTSMSDAAIEQTGLEFVEGDTSAFEDGGIAIHESFADQRDLGIGDELVVLGDGGTITLEVRAVVASEIVMSPTYVSVNTYDLVRVENSTVAVILLDVADGYSITEVKESVISAVEDMYIFQVLDRDDLTGLIGESIDMVLTVLYALLGLSIVIAALGIVNTLSLSVSDRTREIGLLRAIGLSKRGIRGSILIESVIISVLGALIGIVVGVPVAVGLNEYLADDATSIIAIPWGALGIMLILAVIVGVFASILPARRAARLDVLDAIDTE